MQKRKWATDESGVMIGAVVWTALHVYRVTGYTCRDRIMCGQRLLPRGAWSMGTSFVPEDFVVLPFVSYQRVIHESCYPDVQIYGRNDCGRIEGCSA